MRETSEFRIRKRAELLREQDGKCFYCKKQIKGKASLDHIAPVVGGYTNEHNYVVTCIRCNKNKADFIIFASIMDREYYPMVDTPYFFRAEEIQKNRMKVRKEMKDEKRASKCGECGRKVSKKGLCDMCRKTMHPELKLQYQQRLIGKKWTDEQKENQVVLLKSKKNCGGMRRGSGRGKKQVYKKMSFWIALGS